MHQPPPLPTHRELHMADLTRFVRSEAEMDALLSYVQRSSFAPEAPVGPRAFGPMAPPPVPSDRVNLEAIVDRLSSVPAPRVETRSGDTSWAWSPVDLDEALWYATARSMPPGSLRPPSVAPRANHWWESATIAALGFALGSALTLGVVGSFVF